jgi:hypothetical protein
MHQAYGKNLLNVHKNLAIKAENCDITVDKFVILSFQASFAGLARAMPPGIFYHIVTAHNLGFDEPLFEISVDYASALGRFHAIFERPGTGFLLTGGEIGR